GAVGADVIALAVTAGWVMPVVRGGRAITGASVMVDSVTPRGGDTFVGTSGAGNFSTTGDDTMDGAK
ncbi:unnamed protein product, partial [Didymodactylos carnosus]